MNLIEDSARQAAALDQYFARLIDGEAATHRKVA